MAVAFIPKDGGLRVVHGDETMTGQKLADFADFLNGQGLYADWMPPKFFQATDEFLKQWSRDNATV